MNIMQTMSFLIIFNFMISFFGGLSIYAISENIAVDSNTYSDFVNGTATGYMKTDLTSFILSIGSSAGITTLGGIAIGALLGFGNLFLIGVISFIAGTILPIIANTLLVFNKISTYLGPAGIVLSGIVALTGIVVFILTIWYIIQKISGPEGAFA